MSRMLSPHMDSGHPVSQWELSELRMRGITQKLVMLGLRSFAARSRHGGGKR
jgi:hypothetical protein